VPGWVKHRFYTAAHSHIGKNGSGISMPEGITELAGGASHRSPRPNTDAPQRGAGTAAE
jgi:hypothetical protein